MIRIEKGPVRPEMVLLTYREIRDIMLYYLYLEAEQADLFWEIAIQESTPPSLEDERVWHRNFEAAFSKVSG